MRGSAPSLKHAPLARLSEGACHTLRNGAEATPCVPCAITTMYSHNHMPGVPHHPCIHKRIVSLTMIFTLLSTSPILIHIPYPNKFLQP